MSGSRYTSAIRAGAVMLGLGLATMAFGGDREQAKRMHDRLAGVPPTEAVLSNMASLIASGTHQDMVAAAELAMDNPAFYSVTLKNFATPWTNREQSVDFPLNDYSATVIGMIRDSRDFREVLYGDVLYTVSGSPAAFSTSDNEHYRRAEDAGINLKAALTAQTQSSMLGIPTEATAGVMTSRAAAAAFFYAGTNRAMFRFTMMNHMCNDLEQLKDPTRPPDHIRQDVSRSPGGDSRVFLNNCIACHAGMDGMAGAFSHYQYNATGGTPDDSRNRLDSGQLVYTATTVQPKYLINADNFKLGHITEDDSWINYWRNGPNAVLDWGTYPGVDLDAKGNAVGAGAKSLGMEFAHSRMFAECQAKKVFQTVCLREPSNDGAASGDRSAIGAMVTALENSNFDMKTAFAEAAVYCRGE